MRVATRSAGGGGVAVGGAGVAVPTGGIVVSGEGVAAIFVVGLGMRLGAGSAATG